LINSDHRLIGLSGVPQQVVFSSVETLRALAKSSPQGDFAEWLQALVTQYPKKKTWLEVNAYWKAGGVENVTALVGFLANQLGEISIAVNPPAPNAPVRWFHQGQYQKDFPMVNDKPVIAVIDHAGGSRPADTRLMTQLCEQVEVRLDHFCLAAVANWGDAGVDAVRSLQKVSSQITAIIMLQDFVIGGGEGRNEVTELLTKLNVPVLKAIKLRDRNSVEYRLSSDGLNQEKVYYQVAMPELQGASQPLVIATGGKRMEDALTGIRVQAIEADPVGIQSTMDRIAGWHQLQIKPNKDKRIAIIYYNHPPGRHNIGADNLDVPASLWHMLSQLSKAGYQTGPLPESSEALLDMLQERGVNLPRDSKALSSMADKIVTMEPAAYQTWFQTLPATIQQEMIDGPFGLLHQQILTAIENKALSLGVEAVEHTLEEMHHLLEGLDHKGRDRADQLLSQLESCYLDALNHGSKACLNEALKIIEALRKTGIEGLGGWGKAPGKVMVSGQKILLPGLQFGNIFIGPQPPRGWEINEELLHANLAFPPPHQYLAFYHYLKSDFKADAYVHLGRHSTYEFLPRRSVGVAEDDYSRVIAGDIPGIYPYIVDGVGEGIQAKRRGLAVMVDHLTPPLKSTPLYDELLQLRQLVESFETLHHSKDKAVHDRLVQQIREKVKSLNLENELAEAMSAELAVMGITFQEVDDDLLVHEIGHYLTTLQERFMPLGLHIYGKDWSDNAVNMMIDSMAPETSEEKSRWLTRLEASPAAELTGLLNGLKGQFISPGQGNDPIRSPDSLPTGRNFYALDSSLIPSRAAWELGQEMAAQARKDNTQSVGKKEGLVLWASDVVRDEGVMIAFGLDMLGLEPQWNSRGLVKGLKRQTLKENRVRRDTVFTTSGLFRDLYGNQMRLLNQATLMAIDASSNTIIEDYPALTLALQHTLSPLQNLQKGGSEPLTINQVAANWVAQAQVLLQKGYDDQKAGLAASYRVFGDAPGSYGAGINRMAERSGAWEKRSELADVYVRRIGHSYGLKDFGAPAQEAFKMQLSEIENTYFGRSSNLYGLIDNNDAFDYLGGLSLAVESTSGQAPNNFVIDHTDPNNIRTQALGIALRQELRGRFLNPEWLQGLMNHGYAGARTMGSEFLEYLWGWQITNPTLVGDWAWEEVKAVYVDDKYQLELDEFLKQGHNAHVKANMLAIMLVAINKEFWNADEAVRKQLAESFSALVAENGLPGSGHTDPAHPMLPWLEQYLTPDSWERLQSVIAEAKPKEGQEAEIHRITELEAGDPLQDTAEKLETTPQTEQGASENAEEMSPVSWVWMAVIVILSVFAASFAFGIRQAKQRVNQ
ncbi:MAG: cobaltochelatase subunit CobN, partial [Pseudomonadales bacterium]|nr:cobaltochelatase subunit CobN [Pseudomonadales bacterium]